MCVCVLSMQFAGEQDEGELLHQQDDEIHGGIRHGIDEFGLGLCHGGQWGFGLFASLSHAAVESGCGTNVWVAYGVRHGHWYVRESVYSGVRVC